MFNNKPLEIKKTHPGQLVKFVRDYTFYNDNKNWYGRNKFYKSVPVSEAECYIDFKSGTSGIVLDILYKKTLDYVTTPVVTNIKKEVPEITHIALLFLLGTKKYVVGIHSYKQSVYEQMPEDMKVNYFKCYSLRRIS